jgi:hypothetical protein
MFRKLLAQSVYLAIAQHAVEYQDTTRICYQSIHEMGKRGCKGGQRHGGNKRNQPSADLHSSSAQASVVEDPLPLPLVQASEIATSSIVIPSSRGCKGGQRHGGTKRNQPSVALPSSSAQASVVEDPLPLALIQTYKIAKSSIVIPSSDGVAIQDTVAQHQVATDEAILHAAPRVQGSVIRCVRYKNKKDEMCHIGCIHNDVDGNFVFHEYGATPWKVGDLVSFAPSVDIRISPHPLATMLSSAI